MEMKWKSVKEEPPSRGVNDAVLKIPDTTMCVGNYVCGCPGLKDGFYLLGNNRAVPVDGVEWYLPIPKNPESQARYEARLKEIQSS